MLWVQHRLPSPKETKQREKSDKMYSTEGRVRYDPARTTGIANHFAAGGAPISSVALSISEVERFQSIINGDREAEERRLAHEALRDASKKRQESWPDTLQAKREQYKSDRENRLDADERRRQLIDKEEAEYREAKRQQRIADAQKQLLERDERGLHMKSAVLSHQSALERQQQMEWSEERRKAREEDEKLYAEHVRQAARQEEEEKRQYLKAEREKMVALKAEQKATLDAMIDHRRKDKGLSALEGELARKAAEEEMQTNSARKAQKTIAEMQLKEYQLRQIPAKLSPRQTVNVKALSARDEETLKIEEYEERKAKQNLELSEQRRARTERHDNRCQVAAEAYAEASASQRTPRDNIVNTFAAAPSIAHVLTEQSQERQKIMAQHKIDVTLNSPRSKGMQGSTIEKNRNELASPAYRDKLDRQIHMLDRFDQEAKLQKREEDKYLAMVQELQANEKRKQKEIEKAQELEEAQQRLKALAAEDCMFREFVEAQLPPGMSPRGQAKARSEIPRT